MVQNVINGIFVTVTTVQEGVEILEVFSHMATREVECSFSSGSSSTATLSLPSSITPSSFLNLPDLLPSFEILSLLPSLPLSLPRSEQATDQKDKKKKTKTKKT